MHSYFFCHASLVILFEFTALYLVNSQIKPLVLEKNHGYGKRVGIYINYLSTVTGPVKLMALAAFQTGET